jgi:hypothetical protein
VLMGAVLMSLEFPDPAGIEYLRADIESVREDGYRARS